MGLLSIGEPLSWPETKSYAEYIREHGIKQFINLYNLCKTKTSEVLKFGDEIEYMIVKFDHQSKKVRVSNRAIELLKILQEPEENGQDCVSLWRPEFGAYMVEGTPGQPYSMNPTPLEQYLMTANHQQQQQQQQDSDSGSNSTSELIINNDNDDNINNENNNDGDDDDDKNIQDDAFIIDNNNLKTSSSSPFSFVNVIEANMRLRRKQVQDLLDDNEAVLSISPFPTLGTLDFCEPRSFVHPTFGFSRSLFFPDEAIFTGHPRFCTIANNIRERRGRNVDIYLPIFRDQNTSSPFIENFVDALNIDHNNIDDEQKRKYEEIANERQRIVNKEDHIYMDAMGFGMGCCCLQVTFQASNIDEACCLYDQLAPLCPIMMALSAASPIFRGFLSDIDCRWSVIAQSVDDRTEAEITGHCQENGQSYGRIPKSRYDSIDLYISPQHVHYNDINVVYNERYYEQMVNNHIPSSIAKHIAHLFIRDPLVIFKEKMDVDDTKESDHFENIQSTNWQTMRFKPPPLGQLEIGWRVEFRPMELQLTDTENAALVIFIVLLTRLILSFNLNLLIPMSKVEENMKVAQERDAVKNKRFWFRRNISFPQNIREHLRVRRKPQCWSSIKQLSNCFTSTSSGYDRSKKNIENCCVQLTIDEIINGTHVNDGDDDSSGFPGLIPLLNFYLDSVEIDAETRCKLNLYLRLISSRAKGELPTAAQLIRRFVIGHNDYHNDSRVSSRIAYDLLQQLNQLQTDQITLEQLIKNINDNFNKKNQ
ncbi:glutamate-cysteine ligase-like protein [Dermatophagoides farinae]|uniref:Glutamate--cysteine ligase n=1 Tax=Dermatophagoides farinae TaxID=6954 RepID=A0A9D4P7Z2_DERFA|nr:glutamate--cysteine ligase catalytic subunit-like [Dermatophagoides farinae]KAH7644615.1 glutamate-cysteine ligase-like protein [Dermatophagoides farinae]